MSGIGLGGLFAPQSPLHPQRRQYINLFVIKFDISLANIEYRVLNIRSVMIMHNKYNTDLYR